MKIRQGVQVGKRVEYFKGKRLIEALLDITDKNLPKVAEKEEAMAIATRMLEFDLFHASERIKKGGFLAPKRSTLFVEDGFYTWIYQGNQTMSNLATGALIAGFLFFTCFPIWPDFMKIWMWYLSVTFILLIFAIVIIRLFFFLLLWILGYDFWILPRMWDETLGILESFTPLYTLEKSADGQMYWRLGFLGAVVGMCAWAANQPTDFDTFISAQKDFLDDLYSGNLLSDVSQEYQDNLDKPKFPTLEELMQQVREDEQGTAEEEEEKSMEDREAEADAMMEAMFADDEAEDEAEE
mmetsp:Transcript_12429/g.37348  ORF Transcript_12429/g.37348 Transcript_12429/m.37348 type:complete len:296 (-) Transcript_12429:96-983(-)|eukprot:CAMPEP_0118854422 /NCGR_PEP_ID=MMETSP1163-20130328/2640_1 /TAXON_ID=124430 /ORGANISM="Phaeomonas parva, Strain CCMP2877" /LENGTH=295 /DNA_ID=CAMNT_0006787143 /DNA_START=285 /DNA_END=1172 /DNA_ORIENTATION=+